MVRAIIASLLLCCLATPATAASADSADTAYSQFADEFVPAQLKRHHIPGAAVSVVAGDEQVLAKGYGLADVANERPVDADDTVFAPASVAKLLTATAVMQLVEAGKIDLHADVNDYLDFEIDDTYPGRPVTMAHLLTHTAGFAVHLFPCRAPRTTSTPSATTSNARCPTASDRRESAPCTPTTGWGSPDTSSSAVPACRSIGT